MRPSIMEPSERLQVTDAAVVARYLQLRSDSHDRLLARVESHVLERYDVVPSRRIPTTLVGLVRIGFARPEEGEIWPAVFLNAIDIHLALCIQITPERLTNLGTMLNGPQRLKHRHWEDWWGWETGLTGLHTHFFDLLALEQEHAMLTWYSDK